MIVGLYSRVSSAEQAENGNSLPEQAERMKKYCEALGWTVYKLYTDAGFSGGNTNRPGLQALIRDVKAGRLEKVLVYKLDRLSRSQKDTLELIEDVFLAHSTDFVSMSENFDTSTPFGRAMIGILAVFAQLEREQIKERMMLGKEAIAKQGKYNGGRRTPSGYDLKDGEFVVNEFEKVIIQEMFALAAQGLAPRKIAETLNSKGLTRGTQIWRDDVVSRILRSKVYIGYKKFRGEWYKSTHEPIIDETLFCKVQKVRDVASEKKKIYQTRAGAVTTYLGGLLYCGRCGAKYAGQMARYRKLDGQMSRYPIFACNSRTKRNHNMIKDPNCKNKNWKRDDLTALVFGEIRKLALDENYSSYTISEDASQKDAILSEIEKLNTQTARIMDLYIVGQMPLDVLQGRTKAVNEQREKLEQELAAIETKEAEKLTRGESAALARSFGDVLERGNFDEIRSVINALIKKIVIDGDDVTIYWNFN